MRKAALSLPLYSADAPAMALFGTTWGAMLAQGTAFLWKTDFRTYVLVPVSAIAWVMVAVNLVGDRLDASRRGTL